MRRNVYQPLVLWVFFLLAKSSQAPPPDAPGPGGQPPGGPKPKLHSVEVMVGQKGSLKFVPPVVNASVNDQIIYTFFPKNHTVTETSLEEPCTPQASKGAFDSGFVPVSMNAVDFKSQILTVHTTKPIYIACVQKMHCELGMVGGINLPASGPGSLDDFVARAKATLSKAPGKKGAEPPGQPKPDPNKASV